MHYPLLDEVLLPKGTQIVQRDELEELERLGPDATLSRILYAREHLSKKVKPKSAASLRLSRTYN